MATYTTNYNLKKIELTDSPPDITELNGNFDIIDENMPYFMATYGSTTSAVIEAAYQAGRTVYCADSYQIYQLTRRVSATKHIFGSLLLQGSTNKLYEAQCSSNTWSKYEIDLTTFAPLASPALTGNPTAPTQTAGNNSTRIATTAFVQTAISGKADKASPTLTGTPKAPTAEEGTNTTQIATTAFVKTAIDNADDVFIATYGSTRFADVEAAADAGKLVVAYYSTNYVYCFYSAFTSSGGTRTAVYFTGVSKSNGLSYPRVTKLILSSNNSWSAETYNLATDESVQAAVSGKQNTLTFDSTPTSGSSNPVTSGGVYTALAGKMGSVKRSTCGAVTVASGSNTGTIEFANPSTINESKSLLVALNENFNAEWEGTGSSRVCKVTRLDGSGSVTVRVLFVEFN